MEENIMVYKAANMCIIPLCQVSCLDEKFGQIDPAMMSCIFQRELTARL
jgi:hypothetical protein